MLVALVVVLGPLSISMYLPSFPTIERELVASAGQVRLSLSVYLAGFCAGQLFYGPASDLWGRRPVLLVGLGVFVVGSLGCMAATDAAMLIAMRLVQGLGSCVGIVVGRAVLRDRLEGPIMTQMLGVVAVALAAAPMIGPSIGGMIETTLGWRVVFGLLAVLGILGAAGAIVMLPETRRVGPATSLGIGSAFKRYGVLTRDARFVCTVLAAGCLTAHAYIFSAGAPAVFITLLGWNPAQFGALGFVTAGGNFMISMAIAAGLLRARPEVFATIGTIGVTVGGFVLYVISIAGLWVDPMIFLAPIVAISISAAVAQVGYAALAMEGQGVGAGAASAVLGAGQMALGAVGTSTLALQDPSSPVPMTALMAIAASGAFVAMLLVRAERRRVV